jgi:hypothetical protein
MPVILLWILTSRQAQADPSHGHRKVKDRRGENLLKPELRSSTLLFLLHSMGQNKSRGRKMHPALCTVAKGWETGHDEGLGIIFHSSIRLKLKVLYFKCCKFV